LHSKKNSLKELILEKTRELFLTIGFKSVTMDHIANAMGISKKTIYNFFENKTELVKSVSSYMFKSISEGVTEIKKSSNDPISEIYDINLFLIKYLKNESVSPLYQLEKYYPVIHKEITKKNNLILLLKLILKVWKTESNLICLERILKLILYLDYILKV